MSNILVHPVSNFSRQIPASNSTSRRASGCAFERPLLHERRWSTVLHGGGGSRASPIKDFYETLRNKAGEGLDIVILCEFGPGTSLMIKRATMEFAEELAQSGIQVFYMQERRALHKKKILIDGELFFLGSSNLTVAGTIQNAELNVAITCPAAIQKAISDYQTMRQRAKTREELK